MWISVRGWPEQRSVNVQARHWLPAPSSTYCSTVTAPPSQPRAGLPGSAPSYSHEARTLRVMRGLRSGWCYCCITADPRRVREFLKRGQRL